MPTARWQINKLLAVMPRERDTCAHTPLFPLYTHTHCTLRNLTQINKLLAVIPRERNTYLFSATMTSKVAKLQRASLRDPAKVEVAHRFTTPKTLVQQYLFIPAKYKVSPLFNVSRTA
jgi:hypothetical protein